MPAPGSLSVPASFLRIEERTHGEPFSPARVETLLGKGPKCYLELSRLTRLGWLLRLSRGRYATVDPVVRLIPGLERSVAAFRSKCFFPVLQRAVGAIVRVYSGRLKGIVLYGSAARGTTGPESDIDVLVVVERESPTVFAAASLQHAVLRATEGVMIAEYDENGHAHPVHVTETEEGAFTHPGLIMFDVSVDGRVLYDPDRTVRRGLARLSRLLREHGARIARTPDGTRFWDMGSMAEVMA